MLSRDNYLFVCAIFGIATAYKAIRQFGNPAARGLPNEAVSFEVRHAELVRHTVLALVLHAHRPGPEVREYAVRRLER